MEMHFFLRGVLQRVFLRQVEGGVLGLERSVLQNLSKVSTLSGKPAVKVPVYTTLAPVQSSRPLEGYPLSGSPRGCPQVIALSTPDPSPAEPPSRDCVFLCSCLYRCRGILFSHRGCPHAAHLA